MRKALLFTIVIAVVAGIGYATFSHFFYVTTHNEYNAPPDPFEGILANDPLPEVPPFDPDLIDSRLFDDWQVNKSAAVIALDSPELKPDSDDWMLELQPSYADAARIAEKHHKQLLPSANLIDGAAKQFDDGLYAALDLACYQGKLGLTPPLPDYFQRLFDALPQGSPARPFLAAALELAERKNTLSSTERDICDSYIDDFTANEVKSKPISFYTWTPELEELWRFMRFLQFQFRMDISVPSAIADVLGAPRNAQLLEEYRAINAFYSRLTNPLYVLPVDTLIGTNATLEELASQYKIPKPAVSILPPSTSRETELFDEDFVGANFMVYLIQAIRSGEIDLEPKEDDGWYQYQAYALESMLLPEGVEESPKLQLTAKYKRRLLDAFQALLTKRRETHARQLAIKETMSMENVPPIAPRLRVEPLCTFYLRSARAYRFLEDFLVSTLGEAPLKDMPTYREGGHRELPLLDELRAWQSLYYGFYLVACEDIGMTHAFLEGENVDVSTAMADALTWIDGITNNPDLTQDTRVAVPIIVNELCTTIWATLGVRLTPLTASYAHPPKLRTGNNDWKIPKFIGESHYVIAVDDFAEIQLSPGQMPNRKELRALCNKGNTKEKIIKAIQKHYN